MKKTAFVIVVPSANYNDQELKQTTEALGMHDIKTIIASDIKGELKSERGERVKSDLSLDEVKLNDFDGIAFIGGKGTPALWNNRKAVALAKEFYEADKIVGSIGEAAGILAKAGVFKNIPAAADGAACDLIIENGGNFSDSSIEIKDNVISVKLADNSTTFGQGLADILEKDKANVYASVSGKIRKLADVDDEAFSQGMLGEGLAIDPVENIICAPVKGLIETLPKTGHAFGITNGLLEVLVHVGIDTVKLNGEGFKLLAKEGEDVFKGQPIIEINKDLIKKNCPSDTVITVITNLTDIKIFPTQNAEVKKGQLLFATNAPYDK
ncbi:MAG: glucose PTS transporter subunit IIA [Elusimicrobiota bacterium]|jgi:glucose-specific phosphotransferase system IIA component|nr:glucose PTS transporter subunit IIA [Elusimicrobiota bacterium]